MCCESQDTVRQPVQHHGVRESGHMGCSSWTAVPALPACHYMHLALLRIDVSCHLVGTSRRGLTWFDPATGFRPGSDQVRSGQLSARNARCKGQRRTALDSCADMVAITARPHPPCERPEAHGHACRSTQPSTARWSASPRQRRAPWTSGACPSPPVRTRSPCLALLPLSCFAQL